MNKTVITSLAISALAVNVMANGIVTGPVEPNTTAPVATGYNSIAGGANTTVTASNSVALGRDNNITADNTVVIGGGNGNVIGGQSTVIGYNNMVDSNQEQVIIGANSETAGQGATVIGTHGKATAWDAIAVGNNTIADKSNSLALGTNSVTDNAVNQLQVTVNGTTYVFAGTDATSVVSVGSKDRAGYGGVKYYVRQIQNVAAGRVDASSTDAINGSQLHAAYDAIDEQGNTIANISNQVNRNTNSIVKLGDTVNENTKQINQHTISIANNTNHINSITTDVHNNTNAINTLKDTSNNHETRITTLEQQRQSITGDVSRLNERVNRLGASAAALANLHPMEFNADDKFSVSIGYGHYSGSNTVALGAYYRPNEKVLLGVSGTMGKENMFGATASFRFGKSSEYNLNHKGDITELKALVDALTKEVAELKAAK